MVSRGIFGRYIIKTSTCEDAVYMTNFEEKNEKKRQ